MLPGGTTLGGFDAELVDRAGRCRRRREVARLGAGGHGAGRGG